MYKDTNEKTSAERTKEYKQTWYIKNMETEEEFFERIAEQTGEYYAKFP